MTRRKYRSPLHALISGLVGIIVYLAVVLVLGLIAGSISCPLLSGFVAVLIASIPLVIVFSILFMLGDIFALFSFPLNLLFPLFNAMGSVLLIAFLFRILGFMDTFYLLGIAPALRLVSLILYPLIILVVLVTGYVSIADRYGEEYPTDTRPSPGPGPSPGPTW